MFMYLKHNIDTVAFLRRASCCRGSVYIRTKGGDNLNLKSAICRMVFAVASMREPFMREAQVICSEPEEYALLLDFLDVESGETPWKQLTPE